MNNLRKYSEGIIREENQGIFSPFLYCASFLYGLVQRLRAFLYEKGFISTEKIRPMVISVGNITVGGTGKTPAVIAIAETAKQSGLKVAVLTRGYKGKAKGISPVSDGSRILLDCREAGDEPYLIAKKLKGIPVIKGDDRHLSALFAIEKFGTDLFILDDGYQHLKLHRDKNILLIDATDPFGNGHIIPRGILREPLTAIKRADIVVLTKSDLVEDKGKILEIIRGYNPEAPVFFSYYKTMELIGLRGESIPIETINDRKIFIFSGLAGNRSFRALLERYSPRIIGELTYPDHFYYSTKDIVRIKEEARSLGAEMIITTEKDLVKIDAEEGHGEEIPFLALRIAFVVDDGERWESLLFRPEAPIGGGN